MTPTPPKKPQSPPAQTPDYGDLAELANIAEQFAKADTKESGNQFPDGKYLVKLKAADIETCKAGKYLNHKQIRFSWQITDGPSVNRTYREWPFVFADDDKIGWFKGRIKQMGYPSDTLQECGQSLRQAKLDGRVYEITLRSKTTPDGKDMQNCYLGKCVEQAADAEVAEALGAQLDEAGADEAAAEPAVQHTAAKAPPVKKTGTKAKAAAPADTEVADLLSDLEG